MTGQLTVTISADGEAATRLRATVTVAPNIFTLLSIPEVMILARFAQAIGEGDERTALP